MSSLAKNAQGQITPDVTTGMIDNAATKYHVPTAILDGVFGMETDFGKDVTTSSAGAVGLMQFLPSTARSYGYPLTNNPNTVQAQQQFDAAAHYLSILYKQHGSWDAALRAYSGGGYGLSQVEAKSGQKVNANETAPASILPNISIPSPLSGVEGVLGTLTSARTWLRVVEVIGGGLLILMAIKQLASEAGVKMPSMPAVIPV